MAGKSVEAHVPHFGVKKPEGPKFAKNGRQHDDKSPKWSPKTMTTWIYRKDFTKFSLNHHYNTNGSIDKSESTVYKKVAVVENFYDIIYGVHVEMDGRGGKHAGQKRTYKALPNLPSLLGFGWKRVAINSGPKEPKGHKKRRVSPSHP
ncbi:nucleolar protein 4-like [Trichonephila clavipes]|nr:nucleolar protein 4-like [Trichonephila clavipes]